MFFLYLKRSLWIFAFCLNIFHDNCYDILYFTTTHKIQLQTQSNNTRHCKWWSNYARWICYESIIARIISSHLPPIVSRTANKRSEERVYPFCAYFKILSFLYLIKYCGVDVASSFTISLTFVKLVLRHDHHFLLILVKFKFDFTYV